MSTTAKEFLADNFWENGTVFHERVEKSMIEFAKIKVKEALVAAAENVSLTDFAEEFLQEVAHEAINKDSILTAYSLDNIK